MKIAVLGGGHGCYAAAADLSEQGHEVRLWRRDSAALMPVKSSGRIVLTDAQGTRDISLGLATDNLHEAITDAELVLIPLPALAQADLANHVAPHLEDGQVVYLPPGTFGTLLFVQAMQKAGNKANVAFAETGTLPWLARKHGADQVTISVRATRLPTGVYPARETKRALDIIAKAFPSIEPLHDVLDGALMNAGPIIHPPLIMMNAGPLEHFDIWDIHNEGTQPSIRRVTNALDDERIALREALGYDAPHFPLSDHYDDNRDEWMYGNSSHEKLTDSGDWRENIDLLSHRYMREDTALGLVFYVTLGSWTGIKMPVATGLVSLASAIVGEDLLQGPRAWQNLGLADTTRDELSDILQNGWVR